MTPLCSQSATSRPPASSSHARILAGVIVLASLALGSGCGGAAPEPPPAAPQRVENSSLGLALAAIPDGFRVEANEEGDAAKIVLARKPQLPPGTAVYEAAPEQAAGVNLVAAVKQEKEHIESLAEGKFLGQTELMGPTGTAYIARGRYRDEAGAEIERMRMVTLHPTANRLVTITYTYEVSGDTKDRGQQMMDLLAEVEPLATETPATEGEPSGT